MYECVFLREGAHIGCSHTLGEHMNMRTTLYVNNHLFISSHFIKKKFSMGTWEHLKFGGAPPT
jgi:hypothetical protein